MPHRNEEGKIITSKTPLLSNHSIKISNQEPSKVSNKMKNKANNATNSTEGGPVPVLNGSCQQHKPSSENGEEISNGLQEIVKGKEHSIVVKKVSVPKYEGNLLQNHDDDATAVVGSVHAESLFTNGNEEELEFSRNGHGDESPSLKNGFLHFHPSIKDLCDVPCRKDFIKTLDSENSRPKKIYRVVLTGGK